MNRPVERLEISMEELEDILERAKTGPLTEEECAKLHKAFETLMYVTDLVGDKDTTIARLRKILFGASTEKIRNVLGGPGLSVLAASVVLGIMVLPTITSISVDALQAVPRAYREGSIALGATRWQTTTMVMLKAARSGLVAAVILGMGRAIGETMAVIMVAGNSLEIPTSLLDPVRTLTSNIALEMGYASGDHRRALFATGITLFVIILALNTLALTASRRRSGAAGAR